MSLPLGQVSELIGEVLEVQDVVGELGLVLAWHRDFLPRHLLNINAVEPRVPNYILKAILGTQSLGRVLLEALENEVLALLRHGDVMHLEVWEGHVGLADLLDELVVVEVAVVAGGEGWVAHDDFVGQDSQRPPIQLEIVTLLLNKLRSKILRCATERISSRSRLDLLADTKINDSGVAILTNEHILGLEVPVHDVFLV